MPKPGETEGGRHKMPTAVKPIRATHLEFKSEDEFHKFINYATSKEKTHNETMDRVRRELKNHQRSPKRK